MFPIQHMYSPFIHRMTYKKIAARATKMGRVTGERVDLTEPRDDEPSLKTVQQSVSIFTAEH